MARRQKQNFGVSPFLSDCSQVPVYFSCQALPVPRDTDELAENTTNKEMPTVVLTKKQQLPVQE